MTYPVNCQAPVQDFNRDQCANTVGPFVVLTLESGERVVVCTWHAVVMSPAEVPDTRRPL